MPTYAPVWLDPADVAAWLRLNAPQATTDQGELDRVCADAERRAEQSRPEWWIGDPDIPEEYAYIPDAETYQGAVMYAARTIRRRNSPSGIETAVDGNPVFVSRYDADIAARLKLDIHIRPGVG